MSKYWFRKRQGLYSKDLGWGWVPISWQGWLLIIAVIGVILATSIGFGLSAEPPTVLESVAFFMVIVGSITLGAFISHLKTRP